MTGLDTHFLVKIHLYVGPLSFTRLSSLLIAYLMTNTTDGQDVFVECDFFPDCHPVLIVNNTILLLDFVKLYRREGHDFNDTSKRAIRVRTRPILMTLEFKITSGQY